MADSKNFHLEILTPLKTVFSEEVQYIMATGADGYFGVLVNHASMLSGLGFGPLCLRLADGTEKWFAVSDGFFEINKNKAALLVDTAEPKEDIDVARAQQSLDRAKSRIANHEKNLDIDRAQAAIRRALVRIQTAGKK